MKTWLLAAALFCFPILVFLGGVALMNRLARVRSVKGMKPLYVRFGYNSGEVRAYWERLAQANGLSVEYRSLKLDLFFPFFYGGALMTSLLLAWSILGGTIGWYWVVLPVGVAAIADWTENTALLNLLERFVKNSNDTLPSNVVTIASSATNMKLIFLGISGVQLLCLIVKILRAGS